MMPRPEIAAELRECAERLEDALADYLEATAEARREKAPGAEERL